jgi:hypothetical protein
MQKIYFDCVCSILKTFRLIDFIYESIYNNILNYLIINKLIQEI